MISFYIFRNELNNKVYVGSSIRPDRRYQEHCSFLYNNKHPNKHLQNAFNQNDSFFKFKVLFTLEDEITREYFEQKLINYFGANLDNLGYNLADAAGVHYTPRISGERHHRAVLLDKDVKKIYNRLEAGEKASTIATEFLVNVDTIRKIRQGKNWKNVTGGVSIDYNRYNQHATRKLSNIQINEIRNLHNITQKEIALIYNVTQSVISRIKSKSREYAERGTK